MIKFWIGIFLIETKGLLTLPFNYTHPDTGSCDCSLSILSLEYFKGNEYLVTFSGYSPQYREIVQMECVSNKTGEKIEIWSSYYTDDGFIINVDSFVENDIYTFFVIYRNCSNCTVAFEFKAPEKIKRNIPVFVGIVAVVSLMIIAMCFYNIRSKCIFRFIQELKRLPFLVNCTDNHFVEFEAYK